MTNVSHYSPAATTPPVNNRTQPATVAGQVDRLIGLVMREMFPRFNPVMQSRKGFSAVQVRHLTTWLAFKIVTEDMGEIGEALDRDRTSVLYAIRAIDKRRHNSPDFMASTNRLLDLAIEQVMQ